MSPFIKMLVDQEDHEFLGFYATFGEQHRTFFFVPVVDHCNYWTFQETQGDRVIGEESESFPNLEAALCAAYLQTKSEGPF